MALLALVVVVVLALPVMLKDGPVAEGIWLGAILAGLIVAAIRWADDAPARRQRAQAAALARRQAQIEAARRAAEHAAWLAPKRIGNARHHGGCTTNHRTYDTAARCTRG
ncbi:MAG TPA: hypothetical protein VGN35_03100 [Jatrophihabitantaceae bacterium]|nr:hypothetical protein [Jatrophihabitantaceae bacterium]